MLVRRMWFMRALGVASLVVAVAMSCAACAGGGGSNPAAPTPTPTPTPRPIVAQAAGVWTGVSQTVSVDGGECVGVALAMWVNRDAAYSLDVKQSGSDLTAVSTSWLWGLPTYYSGTAGSGSISLSVNPADWWVRGYSCLKGGERDVQLVSDTISMTVSGDSGTATASQTYNVFVAGTMTGVGTMIVTSSFPVGR
jgi:hypothetical protein